MIHKMKLYNEPYENIKSGIKTIELRLNDEKRQKIMPDDTIIFINTETHKRLAVRVKQKHYASSFEELFNEIKDSAKMGFVNNETPEDMVNGMRSYYSESEEKKYGVVGIELYPPKVEVEFPVECREEELKYVITIAIHGENIVFCKHKERETIELPGGHIEHGETPLEAAKRELYEETGIENVKQIIPIANYHACTTQRKSNGAFGKVFVAIVDELPEKMPNYEMESIKLIGMLPYKKDGRQFIPRLPIDITHFEIYSVIMYAFQRIMINDDLNDEGYSDYYTMLKYYDEDVCVDYTHFEPDEYLHYVIMREDCKDYVSPLYNIAATKENYDNIRDELMYSADVLEYFEILVDKFGVDMVRNDSELIKKMYDAFDNSLIDKILQ